MVSVILPNGFKASYAHAGPWRTDELRMMGRLLVRSLRAQMADYADVPGVPLGTHQSGEEVCEPSRRAWSARNRRNG